MGVQKYRRPVMAPGYLDADGNPISGGAVESVNGQSGAVVLTAADVGALADDNADVSALAAARATPAANSTDPADIAAVLVALGVMAAE